MNEQFIGAGDPWYLISDTEQTYVLSKSSRQRLLSQHKEHQRLCKVLLLHPPTFGSPAQFFCFQRSFAVRGALQLRRCWSPTCSKGCFD